MSHATLHASPELRRISVKRFFRLAEKLYPNSLKHSVSRFYRTYLSPLSAALLMITVLFFFGLLYELFAPLAHFYPPKTALPRTMNAALAIPSFIPPPIEAYAEIDRRPIFNPQRIAVKAPSQDVAAPSLPPPRFTLVGVILQGLTRIAITRGQGATTSTDVAPGQTIEGWQVVDVTADRIELRSGSQTFSVPLTQAGQTGVVQSSLAGTLPPQSPLPH